MKRSNTSKKNKEEIKNEVANTTKRIQRGSKSSKNVIDLINCHCCKLVDSANKMITCSKINCRESFCFNCIKRTYLKFNENSFFILKEKEANNIWKCYKCNKKCPCISCEESKDGEEKFLKRKRLSTDRPEVKKVTQRGGRRVKQENSKMSDVIQIEQDNTFSVQTNNLEEAKKSKTMKKLKKIPQNANQITINKFKIQNFGGKQEKVKIGEFYIYEQAEEEEEPVSKDSPSNEDVVIDNKNQELLNFLQFNQNTNFNIFDSAISLDPKIKIIPTSFVQLKEEISETKDKDVIINKVGIYEQLNNYDFPDINKTRSQHSQIKSKSSNEDIKINEQHTNIFETQINVINSIKNMDIEMIKKEEIINNPVENERVQVIDIENKFINAEVENIQQERGENNFKNYSELNPNLEESNSLDKFCDLNYVNNQVQSDVNFPKENEVEDINNNEKNLSNVVEISDINSNNSFNKVKKPLTKPCSVCGNSHLEKSEIIKFNTFKDFLSILYKSLELKPTDSKFVWQTETNVFVIKLNNKSFLENPSHIQKLKTELEKIKEDFDNGEIKQENNFKRTKRICNLCLFTNLSSEKGLYKLLDAVVEEDEKAELDVKNKEEILRNINNFMCPLDKLSEDQTENKENKVFNIFDNIFGKKKCLPEDLKLDKSSTISLDEISSKAEKHNVTDPNISFKSFSRQFNIINKLGFLNDSINIEKMRKEKSKSNQNEEVHLMFSLLANTYHQLSACESLSKYNNLIINISFFLIDQFISEYSQTITKRLELSKTIKDYISEISNNFNETKIKSENLSGDELNPINENIDRFLYQTSQISQLLETLQTVLNDMKIQNENIHLVPYKES